MTKTRGSRVSKRVAIYLRVSTSEQTTTNQRRLSPPEGGAAEVNTSPEAQRPSQWQLMT